MARDLIASVKSIAGAAGFVLQPPYHEIRWLMVRQGYEEGLDSDDAYDNAVKKLADTPAHCKRSMMMKSYQMVERRLSPAASGS